MLGLVRRETSSTQLCWPVPWHSNCFRIMKPLGWMDASTHTHTHTHTRILTHNCTRAALNNSFIFNNSFNWNTKVNEKVQKLFRRVFYSFFWYILWEWINRIAAFYFILFKVRRQMPLLYLFCKKYFPNCFSDMQILPKKHRKIRTLPDKILAWISNSIILKIKVFNVSQLWVVWKYTTEKIHGIEACY